MKKVVPARAARKLRQFKVSLAQRGVAETLYWAAYGYLRPHRFAIFARRLTTDAPEPVAAETLALWSAHTLRQWRAGRPRAGLSPEFFQDEVDGVSWCVVAIRAGEVVGLVWIYRPGDPSRMFRLRPGEVEFNYAWVQPAFRGRRLFAALLTFGGRALAAQGYRHGYGMVHSKNPPSLRSFTAAGFADVASVWHFFLFRPAIQWHDEAFVDEDALPALAVVP